MNRSEKEAAVAELATQISEAEAIFAIDYRGISVPQAAELRAKLRESDTTFRVAKNRLTKLAAAKVGQEGLDEVLTGPTALTFVRGDVAQAAKAITTFSRENEILTFKGGLLGDLVIDEARFKSIARLPSREVLNGQLAGVVASPLTGLVRGLNSMISGLAIALGQIAEQGLVGQGAGADGTEPGDESGSDAAAEAGEPEGSGVEEAAEAAADEEAAEAAADGEAAEGSGAEEAAEGSGAEEAAEAAADEEPAATPEPAPEGSGSEAEQPSVNEEASEDSEGEQE